MAKRKKKGGRGGKRRGAGRRPKLRSAADRQRFLALLRKKGGYLGPTCRAFGVAPATFFNEQNRDHEFAQQVKQTAAECFEDLEASAYERAMKGSDSLMRFLLAVGNPKKYSARFQIEHAGEVTVNHDIHIAIVEDPDWYGQRPPNLDDQAAGGLAPSDPDLVVPGTVQGSGLRPALGKNGSRPDGHDPGPRPEAGDVPGGG